MIYHKVRSRLLLSKSIIISLGLLGLVSLAQAQLIIHRTTTDLVDLDPGADRWSASYSLQGIFPSLNQGFSIFFDAAVYRDLSGPVGPIGFEWDSLLVQPDTGLPSPGFFDLLALTPRPTFPGPFTIQFTLLSGGQPGTQDFEVYNLEPSFSIIQRGQIGSAAVPEPTTLGGAAALALFFVVAHRRFRRRAQGGSLVSI